MIRKVQPGDVLVNVSSPGPWKKVNLLKRGRVLILEAENGDAGSIFPVPIAEYRKAVKDGSFRFADELIILKMLALYEA